MGKQETCGTEEKLLLGQGKKIVGILTGDTALELQGVRQQTEGATREKLGTVRRGLNGSRDGAAGPIGKHD